MATDLSSRAVQSHGVEEDVTGRHGGRWAMAPPVIRADAMVDRNARWLIRTGKSGEMLRVEDLVRQRSTSREIRDGTIDGRSYHACTATSDS